MPLDDNRLRAAARFADAVALGLQHLEENTPIHAQVQARGWDAASAGPVDGMCDGGFVPPLTITTLNELWLTQRALARLLRASVSEAKVPREE